MSPHRRPNINCRRSVTVAVITKLPSQGKSRLRRQKSKYNNHNNNNNNYMDVTALATAFLMDTLTAVTLHLRPPTGCAVDLLLFHPTTTTTHNNNNDDGSDDTQMIAELMNAHSLPHSVEPEQSLSWTLVPLPTGTFNTNTHTNNTTDANNTTNNQADLSSILEFVVHTAASRQTGPVAILGMDAPEVPLDELRRGLGLCGSDTTAPEQALLVPATDGGYVLLTLPVTAVPHASQIFRHVAWSTPYAAVSQLKALTDAGIAVQIGRLVHDVDEWADVVALRERLLGDDGDMDDDDKNDESSYWGNLSSSSGPNTHDDGSFDPSLLASGPCWFTRHALAAIRPWPPPSPPPPSQHHHRTTTTACCTSSRNTGPLPPVTSLPVTSSRQSNRLAPPPPQTVTTPPRSDISSLQSTTSSAVVRNQHSYAL